MFATEPIPARLHNLKEFNLITLAAVLLIVSVIATTFGSLRWGVVALLAAMFLLSPTAFLALVLVGGLAVYFAINH